MLLLSLLVLFVLACITAGIAHNKGGNGVGWFFYAIVLWPVAFIHALLMRPHSDRLNREAIAQGVARKCSFCAEVIKAEASVCRFCGRDVPAPPIVKPESAAQAKVSFDRTCEILTGRGFRIERTGDGFIVSHPGLPPRQFATEAALDNEFVALLREAAPHYRPL